MNFRILNSSRPAQASAPRSRELLFLTIPQLGLMLCHLAISLTDVWTAGQIDAGVLAVLGFITQISTFLRLLISLVGSGCMATVSQALGAGRRERAARYAGLIVAISFLSGCIVALTALTALPLVLRFGHVPEGLKTVVVTFSRAYAAHLPCYYCMIMLNSVFRAHKLVWLPLGTLALVALLNLAGSAGLGLGLWGLPRYGFAAVAWATFFSSLFGVSCNLLLAARRGILTRDSFGPWRWNRIAAPRLWHIGAPAALGNLVAHLGAVFTLTLLADMPQDSTAAVGGLTVGARITACLGMPLNALGMTVTILSGHLIGARRSQDAYALGRDCAVRAAVCMGLAALVLAVFREGAARLLATDRATIVLAACYLLPACCALPFQAVTQMLSAVLAGAGATRSICWIGCISTWCVGVPTAWLLAYPAGRGAGGIYVGMALGSMCAALLTVVVFRKRQWQKA